MTANCDWPHCIRDSKPGYAYCPQHMSQWEKIRNTSSVSGLQEFLVFLWGEVEELERRLDKETCHCESCQRRRDYD